MAKGKKKSPKPPKPQYGEPRPAGVAGQDAVYITKSLNRWRLRGDGTLKS